MKEALKRKIESKEAVIGIIGLGYVGLPLVIRFADVGFKVLGFDINDLRCEQLNRGESFIKHIPSEKIKASLQSGFEATTDFSRSKDADALLICVPTPLTAHREPDMTYIHGTMRSLKSHLREGQLLALESTTYPGTTREELRPYLEEKNLKVGENFFLVYSPEREDPGNPHFETRTIPKVCGGETPACLEVGVSLYESVIEQVVPVSSTKTAEMVKLLENIHRAVNIGLVNEMKIVADRMNIDIHEVIRAAATKPFGFTPYYPGPGLGGHCIPIDPFYLTWKAREYGVHTRFIELAGEVNTSMPDYVISKVADGLNQRGRALNGSRVLILGLSYKKNVDDDRESPSVVLMDKLMKKGAHVDYADPYIPKFKKMRHYDFDKSDMGTAPETLQQYDCVLIATNHDDFNYAEIYEYASLIVDTRGVYEASSPKVIKA